MSTPNDILLALQTLLRSSSALSYVNDDKIYLGQRTNYDSYPAICLDVESRSLEQQTTGNRQYLVLRISIIAIQELNTANIDEITADTTLKSILTLENDILKAIDTNSDITFVQSSYDSVYPVRAVKIEVDYKYNQQLITRT